MDSSCDEAGLTPEMKKPSLKWTTSVTASKFAVSFSYAGIIQIRFVGYDLRSAFTADHP